MILYQISLSGNAIKNMPLLQYYLTRSFLNPTDPLPKVLIESGFVKILAQMARITYGNTNMPKFCMQSLVRMTANIEVSESKKVLNELLGYDIVDLISICLRGGKRAK
jgi:hypothetical protein